MKLKQYIHKRRRDHKTTMDLGILYPMNFIDVTMGQTTLLKASASMRFQPLASPAMVELYANVVHFYVPYRILWESWSEFISMQKPLELPTTFLKVDTGFNVVNFDFSKSLLEYAGFPKRLDNQLGKSLDWTFPFFWFMAYYKIWDEHFRDEEIQKDQAIDFEALYQKYINGITYAGADAWNTAFDELYALKRVNWGRDRFTSALLETETEPDIQLPVGADGPLQLVSQAGSTPGPLITSVATNDGNYMMFPKNFVRDRDDWTYAGGLAGVDLVAFRTAMQMWNFKMNQTQFGTKYEDYLKKYGVRNMDGRLQKSEFIGGFTERVRITDIMATDGNDLGKQGGHAYGSVNRKVYRHYAPENGVIISLMYLRPRANYAGGLDRFFFKRDALDFPQMEFIHGYQPIYTQEIGRSNKGALVLHKDENDIPIFGYEERYEEYRCDSDLVTGSLTPNENLSHWALVRQWDKDPVLNSNFLECNPATNIWMAPNEDKAIVHYVGDFTTKTWLPNKTPTKFKF